MKDARNFSINNLKYLIFGKIFKLILKSIQSTLAVLSIFFFHILKSLKALQKNIFVYIINGLIFIHPKIKKMELSLIQND